MTVSCSSGVNGGVGEVLSTSIVFTRTSISPVGSFGVDQALRRAQSTTPVTLMTHSLRSLRRFIVDGLCRRCRVEDELREAVAVAKVDEDQAAVIAVGMNPAGQANFRANIGCPKLAAGVSAVACCDCFHYVFGPWSIVRCQLLVEEAWQHPESTTDNGPLTTDNKNRSWQSEIIAVLVRFTA